MGGYNESLNFGRQSLLILYMKSALYLLSALLMLNFFAGCASPQPHSEFVKTVNLSSLDSFSYKHTLISGMDFRESEEQMLEDLSEQVVTAKLESLGFEAVEEGADFFVVAKWRKALSSYVDPFDYIDPYSEVQARRNDPSRRYATRLHLIIEIYETRTQNLFWRKELPHIFDALQLTEGRIVNSVEFALENFPEHIEKDPNLPNIQ